MISSDVPFLSVDDLADQVAEVLDFFGYVKCLSLPLESCSSLYPLLFLNILTKRKTIGLVSIFF